MFRCTRLNDRPGRPEFGARTKLSCCRVGYGPVSVLQPGMTLFVVTLGTVASGSHLPSPPEDLPKGIHDGGTGVLAVHLRPGLIFEEAPVAYTQVLLYEVRHEGVKRSFSEHAHSLQDKDVLRQVSISSYPPLAMSQNRSLRLQKAAARSRQNSRTALSAMSFGFGGSGGFMELMPLTTSMA